MNYTTYIIRILLKWFILNSHQYINIVLLNMNSKCDSSSKLQITIQILKVISNIFIFWISEYYYINIVLLEGFNFIF